MGTRAARRERLADEELVVAVGDGDEGAFEVLYDRHSRVAWSLAMRLLHDRQAAEDLVQEAFLGLWRGSATYSPAAGSVRTWLLSIVHHRAVDRLRQGAAGQRRQAALEEIASTESRAAPDTADLALGRVQAAQIRSALADVPDDQQHVLELAYYGGYTHDEIAQLLALPLGTVKSRMRLGLERVRRNVGAGLAPT